MAKQTLDFLIIGAEKGGTTSLFEYMRRHPGIYMPSSKECRFFTDEPIFRAGWGSYLKEYFSSVPEDRVWGTADPGYLVNSIVPERIYRLFPEIRLIAILRHPIERAFSHYRMAVRRSEESRSFDQAIREQLHPQALQKARSMPNSRTDYVIFGEYGRGMREYRNIFSAPQIGAFFLNDLEMSRATVLAAIFKFIDVSDSFVPSNIEKIYHRGGIRRRWQWLENLKNYTKAQPAILGIWRKLPVNMTKTVSYWIETRNVLAQDDSGIAEALSASTRAALAEHYLEDARVLQPLIKSRLPWVASLESDIA